MRTRKEIERDFEPGDSFMERRALLELLLDIRNLILNGYGDYPSRVKAALFDSRIPPVDTDVGL